MRFSLLSFLLLPLASLASQEDQNLLFNPMSGHDSFNPLTVAKPTLADLLTIETSASIFYSYARELELSELFNDPNARTTILVPTNNAVMALPRKPHQDPHPIDEGVIISDEEFDALSKSNVEKWVSAHIIPDSPISLSSPGTFKTLREDKSISVSLNGKSDGGPEWSHVVIDGKVHITAMKVAANGVLYVIDRTIEGE